MNNKSIKDFFQKNAVSLVVPVVLILIGLIFMIRPGVAVATTVTVIGILFVIVGVILGCTLLAAYSPFTLTIAIILATFGIVCIAAAESIASFVMKVIGVVVLVNSLLRLYDAYQVKGRSDNFIKYVINDIITLVVGVILVFMPLNAIKAVVILLGIVLFALGVSNLVTVVRVYHDGRYVDDGTDVVWEE